MTETSFPTTDALAKEVWVGANKKKPKKKKSKQNQPKKRR
jgi:hypothetical protein